MNQTQLEVQPQPYTQNQPKTQPAAYPTLGILIDGNWITSDARESAEIRNPATLERLGLLPLATTADLDTALTSAQRAFLTWSKVPAIERAKIVRDAARLLRERIEFIATALTLEQGKPLAEARAEISTAADIFEWNADEARRAYGRVVPARTPNQRNLIVKEAIGVVAAFAPWNFPAATAARKISASIAAGCACIIKPAEETPATALALAHALVDAGLPPGVLNVVFGNPSDISTYLMRSPFVRKISFTGSTAVGIHLARIAADDLKRCTLELGGHAPVIVCEDSDPAKVAREGAAAKFRNAGQICVAPTRFYIQAEIFDSYVKAFVSAANSLVLGNGMAPTTEMGPLANPRRVEAMRALVADAVACGATLVAGGEAGDGSLNKANAASGYFWKPTVLTSVPDHARIMNEEPFGPIAVLNSYTTLDEAIDCGNRLRYGLAAYAHTASAQYAQQISDGLRVGAVGINTYAITQTEVPFGGVDDSGDGKEGGIEGIDGYLISKVIMHAT